MVNLFGDSQSLPRGIERALVVAAWTEPGGELP
jgi:hypothetical protein